MLARKCSKCKETKPRPEFFVRKVDGTQAVDYRCKKCRSMAYSSKTVNARVASGLISQEEVAKRKAKVAAERIAQLRRGRDKAAYDTNIVSWRPILDRIKIAEKLLKDYRRASTSRAVREWCSEALKLHRQQAKEIHNEAYSRPAPPGADFWYQRSSDCYQRIHHLIDNFPISAGEDGNDSCPIRAL